MTPSLPMVIWAKVQTYYSHGEPAPTAVPTFTFLHEVAETLIQSLPGMFVIFRNNLNGFLDFYHGTNVDAGEPKASYLLLSRGCWLGLRLFGSYWFLNHFLNGKLNKIETENCIGIWECFSWCCWKALWQFKFNRVYFTIFRAKVWKILSFEWMDFVVGNSIKLQKLGLEGKISWALNVFTLPNYQILNSENVKNKRMCSHLGQGYRLH